MDSQFRHYLDGLARGGTESPDAPVVDALVVVKPQNRSSFTDSLERGPVEVIHAFSSVPAFLIRGIPENLLKVADLPGVVLFERDEDLVLASSDFPVTVDFTPYHENLFRLTGKGVRVALVDSGVDLSHPVFRTSDVRVVEVDHNLLSRIRSKGESSGNGPGGVAMEGEKTEEGGKTKEGGSNAGSVPADPYGHGTALASLMVGRFSARDRDNPRKVLRFVGLVPGASLLCAGTFDESGFSTVSQVLIALEELASLDVQVYLLPFTPVPGWVLGPAGTATVDGRAAGGRVSDLPWKGPPRRGTVELLSRVLSSLAEGGAFVVTPAGNFGPEAGSAGFQNLPRGVFEVGSADAPFDRPGKGPSYFSGRATTISPDGAPRPTVFAPGVGVLCAKPAGVNFGRGRSGALFSTVSGTSISAAVFACLVAMVKQGVPDVTPEQVLQAIAVSCEPVKGFSKGEGPGCIDPERFLGAFDLLYPVPPRFGKMALKNALYALFLGLMLFVAVVLSRRWFY
ncbi:MAG: S8 family peptidase [Promethearchaeota archaeon]